MYQQYVGVIAIYFVVQTYFSGFACYNVHASTCQEPVNILWGHYLTLIAQKRYFI